MQWLNDFDELVQIMLHDLQNNDILSIDLTVIKKHKQTFGK